MYQRYSWYSKLKWPGGCYVIYTVTIVSTSLCVHKLNGMLEVFCRLVKESGRQTERKSFNKNSVLNGFGSITNTQMTGSFNFSSLTSLFSIFLKIYQTYQLFMENWKKIIGHLLCLSMKPDPIVSKNILQASLSIINLCNRR